MAMISDTNPTKDCEYLYGVKQLRFGVQSSSGFSSLWFVLAQGAEVYVGCRAMKGSSKISLHASGQCHSKNNLRQNRFEKADVWSADWQDNGWAHPLTIVFPTDLMFGWRTGESVKGQWVAFSASPPGQAVMIALCRVKRDVNTDCIPLGLPFAELPLADGTSLVCFWRQLSFHPSWVPKKYLDHFDSSRDASGMDLGLVYLARDSQNPSHRFAIHVQGRLKADMQDPTIRS